MSTSMRLAKRFAWGATVLGIVMSSAACEDQRAAIVASYPAAAPLLGGRAKPSPFDLKKGNISGFVLGASAQPIPLAFVTTGGVSAIAGNPDEGDELPTDEEAPENLNKVITVLKDFDDGKGEVRAERHPRKKPIGDTNDEKYYYQRAGEFFLEGVPEGVVILKASYGNVDSSANPVTVYPNNTIIDVKMNLFIPDPVVTEGGPVPRVVEWTGLQPPNGIIVEAQTKKITDPSGEVTRETNITYKPDPPDAAITLKAPPGSQGTVIQAIDIIYIYNTPERQGNSPPLPFVQIGPIRLPVAPLVISPAQPIAFGPPTVITVPIGSSTLRAIFADENPARQPGLIVADLQFVDKDGFAVQNRDFGPLKVSVVLRAL